MIRTARTRHCRRLRPAIRAPAAASLRCWTAGAVSGTDRIRHYPPPPPPPSNGNSSNSGNTGNNPGNPNASGYNHQGSSGNNSNNGGNNGNSGSNNNGGDAPDRWGGDRHGPHPPSPPPPPSSGNNGNTGNNPGNPNASGYNYQGGSGNDNNDGGSNGGSNNSNNGSGKPVLLDLDGDGIEIDLSRQAAFDMDGDGYLERTSWAAADDGFLVIDLDADGEISSTGGDGVIDRADELVFSRWGTPGMTDLQALAEARDADGNRIFDTDGDGALTSADAVWSSMKVFQDLDGDGSVDAGELRTLEDWGITRINLAYGDGSSFSETDDDRSALGVTLHGLASYVRNGKLVENGVGDVSLAYERLGWRRVETESGWRIEFEGGGSLEFRDVAGLASPDVDLAEDGLAGAFGDSRANVLTAAGSSDDVVISGGGGSDRITGGSGDDLLSGGEGRDAIDGGAGNDIVFADRADLVSSTFGKVRGGEGYDRLVMADDAILRVSDLASIGFESVEAGNYADTITGLDDDTGYYLSGNGGGDHLTTAGGNDTLLGGDGNDRLVSGAGRDLLFGGAGRDSLLAGEGADLLSGGAGADELFGGGGNDRYLYDRGGGHDTILDLLSEVEAVPDDDDETAAAPADAELRSAAARPGPADPIRGGAAHLQQPVRYRQPADPTAGRGVREHGV